MRLQSKFTHSEADSCNAKKIFLAGDSLKTWSDSGEAAAIFWTQILMPLIRSNSRWDCEGFAQDMPGSIARDSLWLRQKMARVHGPKEEIAPPNAAHGAPSGSSQSQWSCIVKETHIAARLKNPGQSEWKRDILARLPGVPSNYGPHRGAGQQFSKRDVFELAIERFPYLCKKTEGQRRNNAPQYRYCLRPLGLPIYEKVMSEVCASNGRTVTGVFGTWEDWWKIGGKRRRNVLMRRIRTIGSSGSLCFSLWARLWIYKAFRDTQTGEWIEGSKILRSTSPCAKPGVG